MTRARPLLAGVAALTLVATGAWLVVDGVFLDSSDEQPTAQVLPEEEFTVAPTALPPIPSGAATPLRGNADAAGGRTVPKPCEVPPAPMQVALPRLCLKGTAVPASVRRGALKIPEDVHEVAMWDGAPGFPGRTANRGRGTTVLAGHVDDADQGNGSFHDLYLVQPGDAIVTTDALGHTERWRVTALTSTRRTALPATVWKGDSGPRRLVLITCGGDVVHLPGYGGHYQDNVIVTAVPG